VKIVLRRGTQQVALVRAAESKGLPSPRVFADEQHALAFLRDFFDDAAALERMRQELFETYQRTNVMRMSQRDLLREMAGLLARGIVRAIQSEVSLAQVYLEADKSKKGTWSKGAGESKNIPSPIVPPEYPILARRESDQVIDSMLALTRDLEAQLHQLFKRLVPPSQVAPEFVATAADESAKIERSVFDLKAKIDEFLYRGIDALPEPALPSEYVAMAESEAAGVQSVTAAMAAELRMQLYDGRPIAMPTPAIAPELLAVAESTAATIEASLEGMTSGLRAQLYPFDSATFRAPGGVAAAAVAEG
jgi:hypothetical protein